VTPGVSRTNRSTTEPWRNSNPVTALASALFHILNLGNVALLYLLPVMAAASLYGRVRSRSTGASPTGRTWTVTPGVSRTNRSTTEPWQP
jgi:hypothetical protein